MGNPNSNVTPVRTAAEIHSGIRASRISRWDLSTTKLPLALGWVL
jgi:hypothetical protein